MNKLEVTRVTRDTRVTRVTRVIVCFTTIPARVKFLSKILNCIHEQDYKIDKTYLLLPWKSKRENKKYPPLPIDINLTNVDVIRCEDYGPITKLYPILKYETDPETCIITFDDDVSYLPNRVSTLVKYALKYPNSAISGSGFIVGNWWNFFGSIVYPKKITSVSVIEGYSGCLYRRKFFDEALIDYTNAPKEAFYHDDVWISGYLALKGIKRLIHPEKFGTIDTLPNGLSHNRILCIKRFFPVLKYFKDLKTFNEEQVAKIWNTLTYKVLLIFMFLTFCVLGIIYLFYYKKRIF